MFQYSNIIHPLSNLLFRFPTVALLTPVSKTMLVIQLVVRFGLTGHSKNLGTNEQHPIGTEGVHDLGEVGRTGDGKETSTGDLGSCHQIVKGSCEFPLEPILGQY